MSIAAHFQVQSSKQIQSRESSRHQFRITEDALARLMYK
jgi:hypothetical protein